jgi:hypothetical protein
VPFELIVIVWLSGNSIVAGLKPTFLKTTAELFGADETSDE